MPPSAECERAVKKMRTCSACQGLPDFKPCSGYCINIMKGCLAYHGEINDSWNEYIGEAATIFYQSENNRKFIFIRILDEPLRAPGWTFQRRDDYRANQHQDLGCNHELSRIWIPGKLTASFSIWVSVFCWQSGQIVAATEKCCKEMPGQRCGTFSQ